MCPRHQFAKPRIYRRQSLAQKKNLLMASPVTCSHWLWATATTSWHFETALVFGLRRLHTFQTHHSLRGFRRLHSCQLFAKTVPDAPELFLCTWASALEALCTQQFRKRDHLLTTTGSFPNDPHFSIDSSQEELTTLSPCNGEPMPPCRGGHTNSRDKRMIQFAPHSRATEWNPNLTTS